MYAIEAGKTQVRDMHCVHRERRRVVWWLKRQPAGLVKRYISHCVVTPQAVTEYERGGCFPSLMDPVSLTLSLTFINQPKLQDQGYGASSLRGMPVYCLAAFVSTH